MRQALSQDNEKGTEHQATLFYTPAPNFLQKGMTLTREQSPQSVSLREQLLVWLLEGLGIAAPVRVMLERQPPRNDVKHQQLFLHTRRMSGVLTCTRA